MILCVPSQNGRTRDLPQRHSATVRRPTSISLPSWAARRKGPRTRSGPSRYGVIVAGSSIVADGTRARRLGTRPGSMRPHAARGTQAPCHRRADRELDRFLHRPPGAGGGSRAPADRLRPRPAHHAARRAAAADRARRARARRQRPRAARGDRGRGRQGLGAARRAASTAGDVYKRWGRPDGLVHAIAFVPGDPLGGNFLTAPSASALAAFETSAFSLKALAASLLPLLERAEAPGGAIVGLDFDATVAWPAYDWAGVSKAALEAVNRYLARDLGPRGVRSNLVAAGPLSTVAASNIEGFDALAEMWPRQAPLGWDLR